jgi:hypothetical protein
MKNAPFPDPATLFLGGFDGYFAEFFQEFGEFEGRFASASPGGFVSLFELKLHIFLQAFDLGVDLRYEVFHNGLSILKELKFLLWHKGALKKCKLQMN